MLNCSYCWQTLKFWTEMRLVPLTTAKLEPGECTKVVPQFQTGWPRIRRSITCRSRELFLLHFIQSPGIKSRWGARFFTPVQTGPGTHPASCTMGTGSFPGVKSGRGVTLNPHPLLMPWSWKGRAIHLRSLWAVRPVQSLSAYTRVKFTLHLPTPSKVALVPILLSIQSWPLNPRVKLPAGESDYCSQSRAKVQNASTSSYVSLTEGIQGKWGYCSNQP